MITIKCGKCNSKVFKYRKIGKGKLLHCWNERIIKDFSIREGRLIKCKCGNLIGVQMAKCVKMKQHSFTFKGTISNR